MNLLLCLTLLGLIVINKFFNKQILYPSILVCIVFFLSSILVYLNQSLWNFEVDEKTFFVVVISLILYSVGANLGGRLVWKKQFYKTISEDAIHFSRATVWVCTVLCILVDYLYYRKQINLARVLGSSGGLEDMFFAIRSNMKIETDLYGLSIWMNIGIAFVRAFGYVCLFIVIYRLINKKSKNFRYIPPLFCLVICELLSSSRIGLIVFVSAIIFNAYFSLKKLNVNINRIIIKVAAVLIIIFFMAFYSFGTITGQSDVYSAWETISIYLGASIVCLDNYLLNPWPPSGIVGQYSFKGINALLRRFGADIPSYSNHLPNVYFGSVGSNIYTALFPFIHDYGILISFIIQLLLGVVFGFTWRLFNRADRITLFTIIYGRFFGYAVCMYSIAERLCSEYLALNVFVEIFFYYIILKFLLRKENIKDQCYG